MNRKGQALVEFIIILPIIIMLLLSAFDYVRILQTKTSLESKLENKISSKDYSDLDVTKDGKNIEYKISDNIKIISPVMSAIIGNNYNVEVTRVFYEQ